MAADWGSRGNQFHRMRRYCAAEQIPEEQEPCTSFSSDDVINFMGKTCKAGCTADEGLNGRPGCNDNNDIELLFSTGKVSSCQGLVRLYKKWLSKNLKFQLIKFLNIQTSS